MTDHGHSADSLLCCCDIATSLVNRAIVEIWQAPSRMARPSCRLLGLEPALFAPTRNLFLCGERLVADPLFTFFPD